MAPMVARVKDACEPVHESGLGNCVQLPRGVVQYVEHGNGLGDVGHAEIRHKVEEGFRGFATLIHTVDCSLTGASGGFGFLLATPGNRATRVDHNVTKQRADRGHVDEFFDVFAWMICVLGASV
jgi:hypothetical protein